MGLFERRRPIRRVGPDRYAVALGAGEREILGQLSEQLVALLRETTDDPSVRRLFPTAYHEDPERDREYQQLVRDELLEQRVAALEGLRTTADATELDGAGLTAWLRAVNDLRLVIGTRLDVGEELPALDLDDPDAAAYVAYDFLSGVLQEVVDALAEDLPSPG